MGRTGRFFRDVLTHVAGYCVSNDVTTRHHRRNNDEVPADAFLFDRFGSRAVDGSLPLGLGITPTTWCLTHRTCGCGCGGNDELQQDESTADMISTVSELISAASRNHTPEPGDVIPTGTTSEVGATARSSRA